MNWPGTASVMAVPIMDANHNGDYFLRLLLRLGENQSYIVGQKMKIAVFAG